MSLKEQIKSKSAAWVRREMVTLPETGLEVQVRGLIKGELKRSGDHKRSDDVQIALSAEDPATGKNIWNPNDLTDLDEIAGLPGLDALILLEKINELSGAPAIKKHFSPKSESSSSPSPLVSEEQSTS